MTDLPVALRPGPTRLAAAAAMAGFSQTVTYPTFWDDAGKQWMNPCALAIAVALAGGEAAGNAWVYNINYPGSAEESIDYGLLEINSSYNPGYFGPVTSPTQICWENYYDSYRMAYAIYSGTRRNRIKAGGPAVDDWNPWHAFSDGNYKSLRYGGKTWFEWGQHGVNQMNDQLRAGVPLATIASVNDDPLAYWET